MMKIDTFKTKTFWAATSGIVAAAGAYATGEASAFQSLSVAFQAVLMVFVRDGLTKLK